MDSRRDEGSRIMIDEKDSLEELISRIRASDPNYLNLFVAQNNEEFESAFSPLLMKAIDNLESNCKNYQSLGEKGISAVLSAGLTMPGLSVTQEANSNGHVDITIKADYCNPPRKKLGEAKIYDGKKYHFDGIDQLLKYMTGRETQGLMLIYVRKKNIKDLIDKLRDDMDIDLPSKQQGSALDHELKWSFKSIHTHSSGEDLEIAHVGCNLYVP